MEFKDNENQLPCSNIQTNVEPRFSPVIARRKEALISVIGFAVSVHVVFTKISQINYLTLVQLDVSHCVRPQRVYEYALYIWTTYEYPYGLNVFPCAKTQTMQCPCFCACVPGDRLRCAPPLEPTCRLSSAVYACLLPNFRLWTVRPKPEAECNVAQQPCLFQLRSCHRFISSVISLYIFMIICEMLLLYTTLMICHVISFQCAMNYLSGRMFGFKHAVGGWAHRLLQFAMSIRFSHPTHSQGIRSHPGRN